MSGPAGYTIRPAAPSDRAAVAAFTSSTFAWGDYIDEVWEKWLALSSGMLFAAVEDVTNQPVAIVHATLPAPGEAWLQGARVHPQHRRRGLADALNQAALTWATDQGATVARLGAEATNEAAERQVSRMGYRAVGRFVYAWAVPARGAPILARATFPADADSVRLATAADAADVARAWRASDGQAARVAAGGLAGRGWSWARFGESELLAELRAGRVLLHRHGLGVLHLDGEAAELRWLDGTGAPEIARAAVQAAWAVRAERLLALVPATAANEGALARAGFDDPVTMVIYELGLPVVA